MIHRFRKKPVTLPELHAIADAACHVFEDRYADFEGPIKLSDWPSCCPDKAKLKALADALNAAGYEWDTLT